MKTSEKNILIIAIAVTAVLWLGGLGGPLSRR